MGLAPDVAKNKQIQAEGIISEPAEEVCDEDVCEEPIDEEEEKRCERVQIVMSCCGWVSVLKGATKS